MAFRCIIVLALFCVPVAVARSQSVDETATTDAGLPIAQETDPAKTNAGNARLVALLSNKAERPILVGSSGELFKPDSDLQWKRDGAGGVSTDLLTIYRATPNTLFAVGKRTPLFRKRDSLWSAFPLGNRGRAAVSAGRLPIISIGRHIYELKEGAWHRIASSRSSVRAIYAPSATQFYVITGQNQLLVGGPKSWRRLNIALPNGDRFVSLVGAPGHSTIAITEQNRVYALKKKRPVLLALAPELSGFVIHSAGITNGRIMLTGVLGAPTPQSGVVAAVGASKISSYKTLWPLPENDKFALLFEDQNRLYVATHRGDIRMAGPEGGWIPGYIDTAPPTPPEDFSKSGPALSR